MNDAIPLSRSSKLISPLQAIYSMIKTGHKARRLANLISVPRALADPAEGMPKFGKLGLNSMAWFLDVLNQRRYNPLSSRHLLEGDFGVISGARFIDRKEKEVSQPGETIAGQLTFRSNRNPDRASSCLSI
jgi:hypothetical protein